jgi:hypothetical protein
MLKALMKKRLPEEGRTDLTTVAIKKNTRDKLDNLGFDRHTSYDLIINTILERQKESKTVTESLAEYNKELKGLCMRFENNNKKFEDMIEIYRTQIEAMVNDRVVEILNQKTSKKEVIQK